LEQFYNQRFPNGNPAIVYGIFFGYQVHRCKKAILMPFFATMSGSIGNRERQPLPQKQTGGAAAPPCHKSKTVGLTCRSAQISGVRSNMSARPAVLPLAFRSTLNHLTGVLSVATISISSNHFDKIRQFLPGIEIYPFAGLVQIGQAHIFFALDPGQILVS
jgi:hypothetical protein